MRIAHFDEGSGVRRRARGRDRAFTSSSAARAVPAVIASAIVASRGIIPEIIS